MQIWLANKAVVQITFNTPVEKQYCLPIIGNTMEDLLHMRGGLEMTLRTTFSSGLGAWDLSVT